VLSTSSRILECEKEIGSMEHIYGHLEVKAFGKWILGAEELEWR